MATHHPVNLTRIASELGISVATVSRALRGVHGINEETRKQIVEAAALMGYSKHIAKEQLRRSASTRKLSHVLVLSETTSPQTDQSYMSGISEAAVEANAAILSHMVAHDRCASVLDPRTAPSSMRAGLVKGVILLHRWPDDVAQALCSKYPTVSIVYDYPGCSIDLIGIDERRGILEIVAHLYGGGHRRIGFFGFCPEVSWSCSRNAAYFEALNRHGLPYDARDTIRISLTEAVSADVFPSGPWGATVLDRIKHKVDAWICPSTTIATSLHTYLMANGLRVPKDVALTGFHRGRFGAGAGSPNLTTTEVMDPDIGAAAITRLMARMANPKEARRTILMPARLVVGGSTRPVSAGVIERALKSRGSLEG